ncbi:prepilin-type N-terminal cleavage/methylation domain-containing protein [Opitutaceae bacterium TAV1]|nr:prepilin-type N-terminal cleavage/methylation domain-containing protein [Opitutaceae bacterium TAV1]
MNSLRKYTKNDMCRTNMDTNGNTTGAPARNEVPCFRRAKAFTLIELLTVIAIIGILAAILLPTLGHVRQTAKQTQNIARLRSLGMACQLYATDNRGLMPNVVRRTKSGSGVVTMRTEGAVIYNDSVWSVNLMLLLSDKWGGRSSSDYLPGPDAFYGPFTPLADTGRESAKFKEYQANAYLIGYMYYSLPEGTDGYYGREPIAPGLSNERNDRDYLRSTPLFSDITGNDGTTWVNLTGFNGKKISVVRLDGSVAALDRDYVNAGDSIKKLAGLTP